MIFISAIDVVEIHDLVISPNELQGLVKIKSVEAIIASIDNRISYGMVRDVYELAACNACYIAVGHAFHDANKRNAFACMDTCLTLNGIELNYETVEAGDQIIRAAQGIVDEVELAAWLRAIE